MLARYNPFDVENALRAAPGRPPFPPATDRAAWDAMRTRLGDAAPALLDRATHVAAEPVKTVPTT